MAHNGFRYEIDNGHWYIAIGSEDNQKVFQKIKRNLQLFLFWFFSFFEFIISDHFCSFFPLLRAFDIFLLSQY